MSPNNCTASNCSVGLSDEGKIILMYCLPLVKLRGQCRDELAHFAVCDCLSVQLVAWLGASMAWHLQWWLAVLYFAEVLTCAYLLTYFPSHRLVAMIKEGLHITHSTTHHTPLVYRRPEFYALLMDQSVPFPRTSGARFCGMGECQYSVRL